MLPRRLAVTLLFLASSPAGAQSDRVSDSRTNGADAVTLPVWVTTASRVGLTGLVMDSTNAPVAGADIKLYPGSHRGKHARAWMRSHHQTHSDSTGEFYVPLVPGTYVLRATVPDGAGGRREIAVSQQELTVPSVGGVCIVVRVGRSANEPCP